MTDFESNWTTTREPRVQWSHVDDPTTWDPEPWPLVTQVVAYNCVMKDGKIVRTPITWAEFYKPPVFDLTEAIHKALYD